MESPPPIHTRALELAQVVRTGLGAHNLGVAAAGVALFSFLSIVPTMIAAVSIYGLVSDPDEITEQITDLTKNLDPSVADLLESAVPSQEDSSAGVGAAIGIALALFSASAAIKNLLSTINFVFETPETRSFIKVRTMAILALLGAVVFMGAASFVLAALPRLLEQAEVTSGLTVLVELGRFPLLGLILVLGLSALYHKSPNRPMGPYQLIRPGALVATLLWLLISAALSFYFGSSSFEGNASFAVFGSIIALLMWLNFSALAVLIGAEVEAARADRDVVGHPLNAVDSPRLGMASFAIATTANKANEPIPHHVTPIDGNDILQRAPDLYRSDRELAEHLAATPPAAPLDPPLMDPDSFETKWALRLGNLRQRATAMFSKK